MGRGLRAEQHRQWGHENAGLVCVHGFLFPYQFDILEILIIIIVPKTFGFWLHRKREENHLGMLENKPISKVVFVLFCCFVGRV